MPFPTVRRWVSKFSAGVESLKNAFQLRSHTSANPMSPLKTLHLNIRTRCMELFIGNAVYVLITLKPKQIVLELHECCSPYNLEKII